MDATDPDEPWSRFSATMEALTGIKPTKGDATTMHSFRIWLVGYFAGVSDAETKQRISGF